MFANILKKSLIMIAVYVALIIGIFVLQFKNDSIISEKMGSLHITLLESIAEDNSVGLKNKFSAVFNGISFFADDDNPAFAKIDGKEKSIKLLEWNKTSPLTCSFNFDNGISLDMILTDESNRSKFAVKAVLPKNVEYVKIPYGLSSGASISFQNDRKVQIEYTQASWELNAMDIGSNALTLTKKNPGATYSFFDDNKVFTFASASSLPGAKIESYIAVKKKIKENLIRSFTTAVSRSFTVSEQDIVSYIAAMAEDGQYNTALDMIPSFMKKNPAGNYLATTFTGNLVKSNNLLQAQLNACEEAIKNCESNGNLDPFALPLITDYMMIHPGAGSIKRYLGKVADSTFSGVSVIQAAQVLSAYNRLYKTNKDLAKILAPAAQKCLSKIENSCSIDGKSIIISDNGSLLSVLHGTYAGDAVLEYGKIKDNAEYMAGGELIIYSYAGNCDSFELDTLSELYAITVHENSFYPHMDVLGYDNGKAVWAWNSADSLKFNKDSVGNINLEIDFTQSYTHYVVISGIKAFKQIFIYDMAFRTDPRFETYNSSGYVHLKDDVLLLKSRHRSENEIIRLIYNIVPVEKSALDSNDAEENDSGLSEEQKTSVQ